MPTIKQKAVASRIAENHGNLGKTMLEAGYSPNTAKKPENLTESKGWAELMEEYLPDDLILKAHKDALTAMRIHGTNDNFIEVEDHPVRLKAAELSYKLRGRLVEKAQIDGKLEVVITYGTSSTKPISSNVPSR